MSTQLTNPKNNIIKLQLASNYVVGSGTMVLQAGQGANFTSFPTYFTAISNSSYGTGQAEFKAGYMATGKTSDTLTGVSTITGYTDLPFFAGDYIEQRVSAQYVIDLNTAVGSMQSSTATTLAGYNSVGNLVSVAIGSGLAMTSSVTPTASAAVTVGGTSGQIEYNNAGALGGFTMSGDATIVASTGVITVSAAAITLAKMANFAASSLMGNPSGSGAAPSAITLGGGLSFSGTTLVGMLGTVTTVTNVPNDGVAISISNATTTPQLTAVVTTLTATSLVVGSPTGGAEGTGTINATGYFVNGAPFGGPPVVPSGTSGTITLNLATGNWFVPAACTAAFTLAISNAVVGGPPFYIDLTQAASGGPFAVTWFGTITWVGAPYTAPTMPNTASARLTAVFRCTGTGTFDGWWTGNTAA